jgi:DNA mismatch repair protein MutS2
VVGSALRGRLESVSGARAQLSRGGVRFDVPVAQLRRVGGASPGPKVPRATITRAPAEPKEERAAAQEVALPGLALLELNLVGARVAAALAQLDTFLDRATLEGVGVVRIIHGMGTGALRDAVREHLARSPYVSRFAQADRREGGAGATIAHLR